MMILVLYFSTEVDRSSTVAINVWKEREEFYKSAMPKSEDEENYMLQLALEESQRQQQMKMGDPWQTDLSNKL